MAKNNLKRDTKIKTGVKKKGRGAQINVLAGEILLQALEDLWVEEERSQCIDFFTGEGFHICSKIAGINSNDKLNILNIVEDMIDLNSEKDNKIRGIKADRGAVYELV